MPRSAKIDISLVIENRVTRGPFHGTSAAFEEIVDDVDTELVLRNVGIQQSRVTDEYIINDRDGNELTRIPCREVAEQSFPLHEFIARKLRGIVCGRCGDILLDGEDVVCSRCENKQFREMLETRQALLEGRQRLENNDG